MNKMFKKFEMEDLEKWVVKCEINFMNGLMLFGMIIIYCFILYYLFQPIFSKEALLVAWSQPTFFERIEYIVINYSRQILDIISSFSAGQILLVFFPFFAYKSYEYIKLES